MVSFAQESLIQADARRQSLGKKKQQPFGFGQRDDSKEVDDKNHLHFDVGNSHLKLISAQALQQKTRQLSVCVYSDKFTSELRADLTKVQGGITKIKQAQKLSPRDNIKNKETLSEQVELMDYGTKQKKIQKIQVEEVSPTISPSPKETKPNNAHP